MRSYRTPTQSSDACVQNKGNLEIKKEKKQLLYEGKNKITYSTFLVDRLLLVLTSLSKDYFIPMFPKATYLSKCIREGNRHS